MATLPQIHVHYELREFDGDFDLCELTADGTLVRYAAEIHDRDILQIVAQAFDAEIIYEGSRGTLGSIGC